MESFKEFLEQQDFVDFVINEFNNPTAAAKPWSAKKAEILQMWRNMRPDSPIYMTPISKVPGQKGATYGEDGIRVTGSWQFIASVLGRIKELMAYENPQTKLRLVFRGVDKSRSANPERETFVFYVNAEHRSRNKPGRPKIGL
jgi:hypothetical protein